MTDYDTNLGVDRPNGNVTVSGWMHDAHMAGRTAGWLTKPQINITGSNTFEPFGATSAILLKKPNTDDYIVAGDINPNSMELSVGLADNWANTEVYAWTSNDETTNPNGVGVVHIGMWVHDDDDKRVASDKEVYEQAGEDIYIARLFTLSIQGQDGSLVPENINCKASDMVNGLQSIGSNHPYMSALDTPVMQSPVINGYQMDSLERCVFEYGGGTQDFRPGTNADFNDFYNQWSYFTPGWYLAHAFLSFQPEQPSTQGYYAFSAQADGWSDEQNSNLYFDMNIKTESAPNNTPDAPHAHHEKTRVFYYDGPSGWYNMHLRETTKGFMAPMLSTYMCPYVAGVPCAQIFRIIRL